MSIFGEKRTVIKINNGIHVERENEGYWIVIQTKGDYILLRTKNKKSAIDAGEQLSGLVDWNTDTDVLYDLQNQNMDIYRKYEIIKSRYHTEKTINGLYLETKDSKNNVSYFVMDSNDEYKKVKGVFITDGLSIHEDGINSWTIDHVPTATMLSEVSSKDQALKVAQAIQTILNWEDENAPDVIIECEELQDYLKKVKEAVKYGEEVPNPQGELEYQLIFMQTPEIKENWGVFKNNWEELNNMVGLDLVKEQVAKLLGQVRGRMKNKGKIKEKKSTMHMMFFGPSGTGKTEVARIISSLLFSLGFLDENKCVEVDRSKIVGPHIGHTDANMKKIIKDSLGGVLFIDEAYALAKGGNDFGQEAIDILIKAMEDHRKDLVVILAGYPNDMERLMDSNEGFRSRIRHKMYFKDYTPEQVAEISVRMIESLGYKCDDGVKGVIKREIDLKSNQGTVEGNARAARNLIDDIVDELNIRIGKTNVRDSIMVIEEDVKNATKKQLSMNEQEGLVEIREKAMGDLNNLVGMKNLKAEVKRILNHISIEKQRFEMGISSQKSRLHMIFSGPSGTGKTTVAKIIGQFLKGSGLLSNGQFKKVGRSDLVGAYQGQTAKAVKEHVNKALGGILFIDEAYNLVNGDNDTFGKEAVAELIDLMEEKKDDLVVILAGYEEPIEKLLSYNEGFRSRIGHKFVFPNYEAGDIIEITKIILKQNHLYFDENTEVVLEKVINEKSKKINEEFDGNGRWAANFVDKIKGEQTDRLALNEITTLSKEDLTTITSQDIEKAIKLT